MTGHGWAMTEPGKPFERKPLPPAEPAAGEAVIAVAGCGVCHTDISFAHLGVKTRKDPPLVLGHEISGTVVGTGEAVDPELIGRHVLVPAVLPCGTCPSCRAGQRRICPKQIMPGNDRDGGFASHVTVPAAFLAPIADEILTRHELWELSIVADAVTTPFQAVKRSHLAPGELAVVIGAGGIGIHAVQICAAAGAKVIAIDVDRGRLDIAAEHGAAATIDASSIEAKEIKARVKEEAKRIGAPPTLWRIFETSGTRAGQETAYSLIGFGAHLAVVGFTMDRLEIRLSNLMAFDATASGNWGCDPLLYPEVLSWIAEGRIAVRPFVEKHPLDEINAVFDAAHHGRLSKRAVLVP